MKKAMGNLRLLVLLLLLAYPFAAFLGCSSATDPSKQETSACTDDNLMEQGDGVGESSRQDENSVEETALPDGASGDETIPVEGEANSEIIASVQQDELICPEGTTLESRIKTPSGYVRTEQPIDSLGSFLRNYEMKADKSPVLLYDGTEKGNQSVHAAVFNMPMVSGDLQQCADSIIRIYSEYFWTSNQTERIKFHFVNGFLFDYEKYRSGGRLQISGNDVSWVNSAGFDDSYETFEKYLRTAFMYASTLSMEGESTATSLEEMQIGDIFIYGGSPGHVCMIADICESDGKKAFLLAQGYMPAQEFHILKNPNNEIDPWYYAEQVTYPFYTPEYTFTEECFRHPTY